MVSGKHDSGYIDFTLEGGKLKCAWTLVRSGQKNIEISYSESCSRLGINNFL